MSTKFKGQRKWIREILNKLEELEKHQPVIFDQKDEVPDWVYNLLIMLAGISHPGTKFKNLKKWKAKDLGRFLGRQFAGEHLLRGQVPVSPQVMKEGILHSEWEEKRIKQKHPDFDFNQFHKTTEQRDKTWQPIFRQFMQETLASVCERPYEEASAFFDAFGKATVMKPDEFLTERTMGVGDKMCWIMIVSWQEIERLESIAQLHRILEKALKPHGIVVRYKRIEKLCQRIKLKFKGRGRPPGNKNQTNPITA